jgi:hypothetical protein
VDEDGLVVVTEVIFHQVVHRLPQSIRHHIPKVLILEDHQRDFINGQDLHTN